MVYAIALKFVTVGCAENLIAGYLRGDDLADDIAVGEANDEAVFGSIVFILGLTDEAFSSVVVGFTSTATLVFDLVSAATKLASEH